MFFASRVPCWYFITEGVWENIFTFFTPFPFQQEKLKVLTLVCWKDENFSSEDKQHRNQRKTPELTSQEKEHQFVPEMISEKLQGWWSRQRNYNITKRKTAGGQGEPWFHPCHSPTRYPGCREHSNVTVKSGSWLAQFGQLICENFTQQQELASGGSDHWVSVQ